jgi:uncharacterized protein
VSSDSGFDPARQIASELALPLGGVASVLALLGQGATVPFIARYRKEATGGLDEVQIRSIDERRAYLAELQERRATVLSEIERQGKLTSELERKVLACATKPELEDLYLPFKPKRRTRATMARERGLEPLADFMWKQGQTDDVKALARSFVDPAKEVPDEAAALAGARDICAERMAEHSDARRLVREALAKNGVLQVRKQKEYADKVTKFDTYASYEEPIATIPSHRFLAIRRGESEEVLRVSLEIDPESVLRAMPRVLGIKERSPWAAELRLAMEDAYKRLLLPSGRLDQGVELKMRSDRAAVDVFAANLRELLLSAPFGAKSVLGIDPGQRSGCKCAVVDATGKLIAHDVIYLVQGADALARARSRLRELVAAHSVSAVAVGNGTHGRETEQFVRDLFAAEGQKDVICVSVSEAGASVYSASDVAREEFPDLDLTVRGAVSIARRLQDPLAELVKIDPKSIGVGQYQHDVHQPLLAKKLDEVIESCVNLVGVELNTASAPLLARVAGIGPSLAGRIVQHRSERGAFRTRSALLDVAGVGPRTFEQAAGFLRIRDGAHPLDASAVHPERYAIVERMAADLGADVRSFIGNAPALARVQKERYFGDGIGQFTMDDIVAELTKPGRDPRAQFAPPQFREEVRSIEDVEVGMSLEGVVTNVTAFGAFVDIGVHQDGLVHVSKLSDKFVKDPASVVKVGAKLLVRVLAVDLARRRISLTARKGDMPEKSGDRAARPDAGRPSSTPPAKAPAFGNNPFSKLRRN